MGKRKAIEDAPSAEGEEDFPRGGKSILSPSEIQNVRTQADAAFVKENSRRPRKRVKEELFEDSEGNLPGSVDVLRHKSLFPGFRILGVVSDINKNDLTVSLPDGLHGFVKAEEIFEQAAQISSDQEKILKQLFHVGQLVACTVLSSEDSQPHPDGNSKATKRLLLSLRPERFYQGLTIDRVYIGQLMVASVKSVEDHGYVLSFGLPNISGFLLHRDYVGEDKLQSGEVVHGIVSAIDRRRGVINLRVNASDASSDLLRENENLSLEDLLPGSLVNARVQSVIRNGLLLSFLTYFTGTVDVFHLPDQYPSKNLAESYSAGQRLRARILYVDTQSKSVGLTLRPALLDNNVVPQCVAVGTVFEKAVIRRIDPGLGLLLELPADSSSAPGYANIACASDERIDKLQNAFKEGQKVKARVIGSRLLDGLSAISLKESAVNEVHDGLRAGMVVHGVVERVEPFGAFVTLAQGLTALCPLQHMSDTSRLKPSSKFQVGAKLKFRVLECDLPKKKLTVTHKRTLVSSKLPQVTCYEDAVEGLVTYGWIHGISKSIGCFVKFYNNVKGLAHSSELGLDSGKSVESTFQLGQTVKCRILKGDASPGKLSLSFVLSPRITGVCDNTIRIGSTVSAVVTCLRDTEMELEVPQSKGSLFASMSYYHLCDTSVHAEQMKSLLKPGYKFGRLLVIDVQQSRLTLSAKPSLVSASESLPTTVGQLLPQAVIPGFISDFHAKGCFVRFLGQLTGFVHIANIADAFVEDPSQFVQLGQSVRAQVMEVDYEKGKVSLSLKQSACFSTNASLIESYFVEEEKICQLKELGDDNPSMEWADNMRIGEIVEANVQEIKDYGIILNLKDETDVVGFATHYQVGRQVKTGETLKARILDVVKPEGIVDLSLRHVLFPASSKVTAELHQKVEAVVELVKDEYLVLSIPGLDHAIAYASTRDYNTRTLRPHEHYRPGQRFNATIWSLADESLGGRTLLLLGDALAGGVSKPFRRKQKYAIGSIVEGKVKEIETFHMTIDLGNDSEGKVHVTEVNDEFEEGTPFSKYTIGQTVLVKILFKRKGPRSASFDLSLRPSEVKDTAGERSAITFETISAGQEVIGYVQEAKPEWAWLLLGPHVRGRMHRLEFSEDLRELEEFKERLKPGVAVRCRVVRVDHKKKLLDLTARSSHVQHGEITEDQIRKGDLLPGIISRIYPGIGGILVQVGENLFGRVHVTHLGDSWMEKPDSLFVEGKCVKCSVLEMKKANGKNLLDLSLRPSQGAFGGFESLPSFKRTSAPIVDSITELKPQMEVQGFVKNVNDKGCFVTLAPKLDARILLKNLADHFIKDPAASFPVGKLVTGRILSVEPLSGRVEMTLSLVAPGVPKEIQDFSVGEIVTGRVKRVETFGLFIGIDRTKLTGMCHVSEVDEPPEHIAEAYKADDKVQAKILKVDLEKGRISLGMKKSYLQKIEDAVASEDEMEAMDVDSLPGQTIEDDDEVHEHEDEDDKDDKDDELDDHNDGGTVIKTDVDPLDVVLDEEMEEASPSDENHAAKDEAKKLSKRTKKRLKEEREAAIQAAEEKLLQDNKPPETEDDFEKLVRGSPNSSFVWIKYMAFLVNLAEVDKARAIAERALQTINFREEEEKFNVWIAYLNLENTYGSPPKEAVLKLFQRALTFCDPKKLYLSILGIFERSNQHDMIDELSKSMTRKFKTSAKVWLRQMNNLLVRGLEDTARKTFDRALASLPRHKHIKFITHCAILEFKSGSPERGRSMFDGVLRNYPKRTNLWSLYLDQEIRLGDPVVIRNLFERIICLDLPPKKMKFLFKRYLDYEKSQGDESRIEHVKAKAMEYVETKV